MRTKYRHVKFLLFLLIFISLFSKLKAQENIEFDAISGIVKDAKTKKKLESVNIISPELNIGTVTNADGEFTLKVPKQSNITYIEISHLGYSNHKLAIDNNILKEQSIFLNPNSNVLREVVVESVDPQDLVRQSIEKIDKNYSNKATLLNGFYRETIKKGRNYINISEAVLEIYKDDYTKGINNDRTIVKKGRRLLSQKPSDTLFVKFIGGPNLSIFLDIVKNKDLLFNNEDLSYYKFAMEDPVMIDERLNYVVSFYPAFTAPFALYYGKLFIDRQSLAFSRVEFNLSMEDKDLATQAILRKKPFKLRFKPEEVSFCITYKQKDGVYYLNYVRNEIRFKCDWKRRLFSTNYTILSETVITEIKDHDVNRIAYKDSFKPDQSLSEEVSSFHDVNFWKDYNIIEPTESLESAVGKLKKQYE